jgi:hypothetical protein
MNNLSREEHIQQLTERCEFIWKIYREGFRLKFTAPKFERKDGLSTITLDTVDEIEYVGEGKPRQLTPAELKAIDILSDIEWNIFTRWVNAGRDAGICARMLHESFELTLAEIRDPNFNAELELRTIQGNHGEA